MASGGDFLDGRKSTETLDFLIFFMNEFYFLGLTGKLVVDF